MRGTACRREDATGTIIAAWGFAGARRRHRARTQRYAGLYDAPTAAYWRTRYVPNLRWNLDRLVLPNLTAEEQRAVTGVGAHFPLRDDADPFAYYVAGQPPVITISVSSIRFLDDLAIGLAWLDRHGCSVEPVAQYASVLKYRRPADFPGGRYPLPLPSLGIPGDALRDAAVDQSAQRMLKSAVVFMFAHELGHIIQGHPRYGTPIGGTDAQEHELAADRFAIEICRRVGVVPDGVVPLFLAASYLTPHRGDFETESLWNDYLVTEAPHPVTARRLRALVLELSRNPDEFTRREPRRTKAIQRVQVAADRLSAMAPLLEDPDLQRYVAELGRRIPLSELKVRRRA
jgi:hypothetical protein